MNEQERAQRKERILATFQATGSIRATARQLRMSVNTVRDVLRGTENKRPRAVPSAPRQSLLDPFVPMISRLVLEDHLTAILVLQEIRALGYTGGYSILKDRVRRIRPSKKTRATTVIEHPPGAEGQVDWSPYSVNLGGEQRVVHAFSMVLPFSRFMVVRFALNEQLDTLLALHEEAFSILRAIPKLMTYDNMTTVGRHISRDEIWINPRFADYAKSCGFDIHLIDPGRPNQHGSVERPFFYVETNFLLSHRSRFADFEDLDRKIRQWCDEVANVRIHGTTRERPVDRLKRERSLLLPLPSDRPEIARMVTRKVGSDFCVPVDTNRYSVPPRYVGQVATVKVVGETVEIKVGGDPVAVHPLNHARYDRKVLPEHEEAFKRVTPSRRLLEQAFLRLGPAAEDYYQGLRTQRGRGAGYHLQRILRLSDRHSASVVCGAMAYAARFGNYSADAIARVIAGRELREVASPAPGEVSAPPERVKRWLEGLDVETGELSDYDRIIARQGGGEGGDDEPR